MAGHSHWARIKRAKSVTDARRGKLWSKLARAVIVAARAGGGDPAMNLTLRYAIDAAKAANMPKDTIERAVKKGSGGDADTDYIEMSFEGYAPGGAAIVCTALTDNRNRTAPEIKKLFERRNGNLGAAGSVSWMFSKRGVFSIAKSAADEEKLTEIALEAGADDVSVTDESYEIDCDPDAFETLRSALADAGITVDSAELAMKPSTTVAIEGENAEKLIKLIEDLEDHDDVQNVYGNYEISDADLTRLSE